MRKFTISSGPTAGRKGSSSPIPNPLPFSSPSVDYIVQLYQRLHNCQQPDHNFFFFYYHEPSTPRLLDICFRLLLPSKAAAMPSFLSSLARGFLRLCAPAKEEFVDEKPIAVRLVSPAPAPSRPRISSPIWPQPPSPKPSLRRAPSPTSLYSVNTWGFQNVDAEGRPCKLPSNPRPRISSSLYSRETNANCPEWDDDWNTIYHQSSATKRVAARYAF